MAARKKTAGKTWHSFIDAADNAEDPPTVYVFTVEVVVRSKDLHESDLDRALEDIRCYGSAEITAAARLSDRDPRRF